MAEPSKIAAALQDYLRARGAQAFDWACANCCHFAAGWVEQATGRNPMHGLVATPDARAALKLLASLGGGLVEAWTHQLGTPALPAAFAQVGDVVFKPMPGEGAGGALGVCNGRLAAFVLDGAGVMFEDLAACTHCWRLEGANA